MSSSTPDNRSAAWIGLLIGVVLLGLIVAFAVGLPQSTGTESSDVDLSLPDKLPGGYVAADLPEAFEGGQYADQAEDIAGQEKANRAYGDRVLPDVLGTSAATRTYVVDGSQAVFVQAFQSDGGAFAPNSVPDPDTSGGRPATEVKQVGDGVCILSYGQQVPGQPAQAPAFSQCQVTQEHLTVQIGATAVAAGDLVDVADGLLDDLHDQ